MCVCKECKNAIEHQRKILSLFQDLRSLKKTWKGMNLWSISITSNLLTSVHCKFLNARFERNDTVIFIYSHYPYDQNPKTFDTKVNTFSIRWFCILIKRVIILYNEIIWKLQCQCIQILHSDTYLQCKYRNLSWNLK